MNGPPLKFIIESVNFTLDQVCIVKNEDKENEH